MPALDYERQLSSYERQLSSYELPAVELAARRLQLIAGGLPFAVELAACS